MISINEESAYQDLGGGVERKILATGGTLMTVQFRFRKGAVGALHSHVHEQVGFVASGRFEFTLEGKTSVLGPGDSYYVPSNVVHGALALEAGILVDVFTPQRQDFLV